MKKENKQDQMKKLKNQLEAVDKQIDEKNKAKDKLGRELYSLAWKRNDLEHELYDKHDVKKTLKPGTFVAISNYNGTEVIGKYEVLENGEKVVVVPFDSSDFLRKATAHQYHEFWESDYPSGD
jgi:predicted RNase H-like nuclease (RuvC/YqgF family)